MQLQVVGGARDNARGLAIYISVPICDPLRDPSFSFEKRFDGGGGMGGYLAGAGSP